jgi:hypothetical protein
MAAVSQRFLNKLDQLLGEGRTSFSYFDFYSRHPDYEEEMEFGDQLFILLDNRGYDLIKTQELWPPQYIFERRTREVFDEPISQEESDDDEGWVEITPKATRKVFIPIKRSLSKIRSRGLFMENRFLCETPCSFCDRTPRILFSCAQEGCQWLTCLVCLGANPETKLCGGCGFGMNRGKE